MIVSRPKPNSKSLANYIVHYDLVTMMEEARADYSQSTSGSPRLLEQKDIAARFRKPGLPKKSSND